jgi:hypothetical protein
MGGWLGLVQQGLSPCKMMPSLLGALGTITDRLRVFISPNTLLIVLFVHYEL